MDRRSRGRGGRGYGRPIEPEVITIVPFREDIPVFGTALQGAGRPPESGLRSGASLPARGKIIDTWG